jgi:5-(carboxyamino)imidazole ribonucleotide mutase
VGVVFARCFTRALLYRFITVNNFSYINKFYQEVDSMSDAKTAKGQKNVKEAKQQKQPKVAVIMGSDSDFPTLKSGLKLLKEFGVEVEVQVCSAHRTPDRAAEFAKNAEGKGIEVIIAAAGKAAHLPGVLAAFTPLPVIGIPIKSSTMDGLDSLLSIVQMPSGIPVATVAIDGADNAALLAVQILSLAHGELRVKMKEYKSKLARKVEEKNAALQVKLAEME